MRAKEAGHSVGQPLLCDFPAPTHPSDFAFVAVNPAKDRTMAQIEDAVSLLKSDHEKVADLFEQFEKARGEGRKQTLAMQKPLAGVPQRIGFVRG